MDAPFKESKKRKSKLLGFSTCGVPNPQVKPHPNSKPQYSIDDVNQAIDPHVIAVLSDENRAVLDAVQHLTARIEKEGISFLF